ncbi:TRAP transporter large permease [Shouchella clausii]|uniref:TRAP transporter large permease n=1 Tax=Shouchella clausii TaxID=79880 RepID=UPI000B96A34F|nr:TRAP transporter large permease [Shouchella clausii]MEB5474979.1 TRAP transporter large permease [Shouchella clausii]PTL21628.1 TRAP transporter large permease [Shouchella clausii]QNM42800.1 TRAP transporter large permease [Shouchella clausii]WQG94345.1 TRAP transporter large permease [Shouchella clausii]
MIGLFLVLLFIVLLFLGVPIAFTLGIVAFIGIWLLDAMPLQIVVQTMFAGVESFILLAVPLFILAANIMNQGQISERLIQLAVSMVGHIRGGLAQANMVVSMFFGGISGSAQADTAGVGKILIPSMMKEGYSKSTAVGTTAASSTMGLLIPPSIPMVVYGSVTSVSVGQMFIGGIIPGLLMGVAMMALVAFVSHRQNYPRHERVKLAEIGRQFLKCVPPLLTPLIILGGIIGGFVTPTEAAIIACLYALILAMFVYKTIKWKDMPEILFDTIRLSSLTLFALATASALGRLFSYYRVPDTIAGFFDSTFSSAGLFLFAVILLFLFVGMFLDAIPAMILFVPIVLPASQTLGIDPIHFGIVIVMCLAVGMITPPYGLCMLLASSIAKLSVSRSIIALLPYVAVILVAILIVAFVPAVALWLPSFLN